MVATPPIDDRASRSDGCPKCLTRDNEPTRTLPALRGVECWYQCRDCGHQWRTSWWVN